MAAGDLYRVRLEAASLSQLRALVDATATDLGCRAVARPTDDGFTVDVYVPEEHLGEVQNRSEAGGTATVVENASEAGRGQQAEVGSGNRFAARSEIPRGLGIKE